MNDLTDILSLNRLERRDIKAILSVRDPEEIELVRSRAEQILLAHCGDAVHFRGLLEFSNVCDRNCFYCGIRAGNSKVSRYTMDSREILESALWCAEAGYGSIVLQSGERQEPEFISLVESVVREIKRETVSGALPDGLGITLCVGEQNQDAYRRFRDAGAHRYLLRIETTDPALFSQIHPPAQTIDTRKQALALLHNAGFQVGTGVMIGLPGQTIDMLAGDIEFFRAEDIDMIGMGPYIPHKAAPLSGMGKEAWNDGSIFTAALLMIAAARIALKDVNIAATTALQALRDDGREDGLRFGANVIMPQITPLKYRENYLLYENKPCIDEDRGQCRLCLERRIRATGRTIMLNEWGDSLHFKRRNAAPTKGCGE